MLLHQNLMLTGADIRRNAPYHDIILSQNPLAYFLLDGLTTPTDSSGNGNDMLSIFGSTTGFANVTSLIGADQDALDMNGNGCWQSNLSTNEAWVDDALSFSAIVRPDEASTFTGEFIASCGNTSDGWRFGVTNPGSGDQWTYRFATSSGVLSATSNFGSVVVGTTYHVGFSLSQFAGPAALKVYINGVEAATNTLVAGTGFHPTLAQLTIGGSQTGTAGENWRGVIEKWAVWNRELSASEFLTQAQRAGLA